MTDIPFCSLDPSALATRVAAWQDLDRARLSRRRTPTGAELRYRLEPALAERLLDLIRTEAGCCPGLTMTATLTLTVDASQEIRERVMELFAPE